MTQPNLLSSHQRKTYLITFTLLLISSLFIRFHWNIDSKIISLIFFPAIMLCLGLYSRGNAHSVKEKLLYTLMAMIVGFVLWGEFNLLICLYFLSGGALAICCFCVIDRLGKTISTKK